MDDTAFDAALVASAFSLAGDRGWPEVSVTTAARAAGLPLDRARGRFVGRGGILGRFGRLADQHALAQASEDGSNRDRLFDLTMRRIDFLQTHREGVLALKTFLPRDPGLTMMLGLATMASMAWLLEAAGVPARGWRGDLRTKGMLAVWLCALRAWERDTSEDLSATMAALDKALDRAVRAESWLQFGPAPPASASEPAFDPVAEPPAAESVAPVASQPIAAPIPVEPGHEPPVSPQPSEPPPPPLA